LNNNRPQGHKKQINMTYKSFYEIRQDAHNLIRIKTPLGLPGSPDGQPTDVISGIPVTVPTPKVFEFDINPGKNEEPAHFLEGTDSLVLSTRFVNALRQAGVDNFEIFPAILRDPKTNRKWRDYYLFNEIGLVDAVIQEASDGDIIIEGNGDDIPDLIAYNEVVFDGKKVAGHKMLRIPQCPIDLYMAEEVLEVLVDIFPLEKWGVETSVSKVQ
jgi:hypothetical protein